MVNFEHLTELLRKPALRFVRVSGFYFTNALCHATAYALEEGSSVTDISYFGGVCNSSSELSVVSLSYSFLVAYVITSIPFLFWWRSCLEFPSGFVLGFLDNLFYVRTDPYSDVFCTLFLP
jgi:hypothetical protein